MRPFVCGDPIPMQAPIPSGSLFEAHNLWRYILLTIIWSLTPLAIVVTSHAFTPLWAFDLRFLLSAPIAHLVLKLMGERLPLHPKALYSYAAGSLGVFIAMMLCYIASRDLPSGIIALFFGLAPITTGLITFAFYQSRLSALQWLGLCVSIVGLGMAIGVSKHGLQYPLLACLCMLGSMLLYVVSVFLVRHIQANVSPIAQTTGTLWISCIGCLLLLPLLWPSLPTTWPALHIWAIMGLLIGFSSIIGFMCFFYLNLSISPVSLSMVTVMTPIFAMLIGAALYGEQISIISMWGVCLAAAGIGIYVIGQHKAAH